MTSETQQLGAECNAPAQAWQKTLCESVIGARGVVERGHDMPVCAAHLGVTLLANLAFSVPQSSVDNIHCALGLPAASSLTLGLGITQPHYARPGENWIPLDQRAIRNGVDIVTGEVCFQTVDLRLPANPPLRLMRVHVSGLNETGLFGPRWASTWGQRIQLDGDQLLYYTEDGRILRFTDPTGTAEVSQRHGVWPKIRRTHDGYSVRWDSQCLLHFGHRLDERWLLTLIGNRNQEHMTLEYADNGALRRVVHTGGYELIIDASPWAIRRIILREPLGSDTELVRYMYDTQGRLTGTINATELPFRYAYDRMDRMTAWQDRRGTWCRFTYDQDARCVAVEGIGGMYRNRFVYATKCRRNVCIDAFNAQWQIEYNYRGQHIRTTDPDRTLTETFWDCVGNKIGSSDGMNAHTVYRHDPDGNVTSVENAEGHTLQMLYSSDSLPIHIVDMGGGVWSLDYDARGNLVAIGKKNAEKIRFIRNERGHIVCVANTLAQQITFGVDHRGLPLWQESPNGDRTTLTRDAHGRVTSRTDSLGRITSFRYDAQGNLAQLTAPGSVRLSWQFDLEDNLVEHRDAVGSLWTYRYGPFNLLSESRSPSGYRYAAYYDAMGRLTAIENTDGRQHRFKYGLAGNVRTEFDYHDRETTYVYDRAGRCIERINSMHQSVRFQRNQLGNVILRRTSDDEEAFEYRYDANGLLVNAGGPDCVLQFERDEWGRVVRSTQDGISIEYRYDSGGRRLKRKIDSNLSEYGYDQCNRLVSVTLGGELLEITYDSLSREIIRRTLAGLVLKTDYTASGTVGRQWTRVERSFECAAAGYADAYIDRRYQFDARGYCLGVHDIRWGKRSYRFNEDGRLTFSRAEHGTSTEFRYGPTGRLTSTASLHNGSTVPTVRECEYDATGLLRQLDRTHFDYDPEGRLIRRVLETTQRAPLQIWHFHWTSDGLLRSVTTPQGDTWRYRYDALGRRIAKLGPHSQIYYVWDGNRLAQTRLSQLGSLQELPELVTWQFGLDSRHLLLKQDSDGIYVCISDAQGNPRELVSPDGRLAWAADADISGAVNAVKICRSDCPVRSDGGWYDEESELDYRANSMLELYSRQSLTHYVFAGFDTPSDPTASQQYTVPGYLASLQLDCSTSTPDRCFQWQPLQPLLPQAILPVPHSAEPHDPCMSFLQATLEKILDGDLCPLANVQWLADNGALPASLGSRRLHY